MRGEHGWANTSKCFDGGSSPHARGARHRHLDGEIRPGIIPACAGSTRGYRRQSSSPRDHPRMRGEHRRRCLAGKMRVGSSPHARGARCGTWRVDGRDGIIPACAGSTAALAASSAAVLGSSPHARGAPCPHASRLYMRRIIPACAGSTRSMANFAGVCQDHPRMRGEHRIGAVSVRARAGSSPHARGAPRPPASQQARRRIIPACAGSTPSSDASGRACWDHPRMRGEHIYARTYDDA